MGSSPLILSIGLAYAAIGVVFAWPTTHVQAWRLGAWLVSAGLYGAHILYERFGLRTAPRSAALHVALAVALGGLASQWRHLPIPCPLGPATSIAASCSWHWSSGQ